jgi:anti-sigma regulatory factor (Ser/Thr protein kinase)
VEEEMVLALGELAANAVRHAQTPFEVVVEVNGLVRLEVVDSGPGLPVRRPLSSTRPDGRGLLILDGVCDTWGVHVVDDHKCVWCERQLP